MEAVHTELLMWVHNTYIIGVRSSLFNLLAGQSREPAIAALLLVGPHLASCL